MTTYNLEDMGNEALRIKADWDRWCDELPNRIASAFYIAFVRGNKCYNPELLQEVALVGQRAETVKAEWEEEISMELTENYLSKTVIEWLEDKAHIRRMLAALEDGNF